MKKYVDKDGLAYFAQEFYDKTKDVFATKAQVGSPLVAATVAGMTDTDKIYVYTGSETGYTAGNWYYYDGSDWQSGGVYNSVAVQTDTSLSVAGMAADAKTVGDDLDVLDGRLDTIEGDYVTESEMTAAISANVDATLSFSGKSADAKVVGDFVEEVRDDYYDETTAPYDFSIESERNSGYVDTYGTIQNNASYVYSQRISVSEGDVITGIGIDSNYNVQTVLAMQRICAYSNGVAVPASGVSSYVLTYTVPSGIDSIVISYLATMISVVIYQHTENYTIYSPKIDNIESNMGMLIMSADKVVVNSIIPTVVDGKYVNKAGSVSLNSSYYYIEVDNLKENDVVAVRSFYNDSTSIVIPYFRYVCAYNSVGVAQSDKGDENVLGAFTVPSGITKIALSILKTYPIAGNVLVYRAKSVNDILVNDNVDSAVFASNPQTVSGSISASGTLILNANSVKKNKDIIFVGNITAFNELTIGQGTNDLNSSKIVIDDTNVTFYRGADSPTTLEAHGLTIGTYISVVVSVNDAHIPTVTIMTQDGTFSKTYANTWVGCSPNVYVTADASTSLTNCTLSFVCEDIKKPLWIFGDSYVSFVGDRWPYYISQMGYTDYLLNGYSGEPSAYAMQNLRNLLSIGTPKYIVWALGMNDADNADSINNVWKAVYDELIALCNDNNITPILCTIPNVPSRNHRYKNAIVMASGYDYIDFASAVGALDDSTWYTGMLSQDGVHPTELGAIALASAVLKDFPYICIK